MKVLKAGHLYEVDSMDNTNPQQIQFIEKEPIEDDNIFYSGFYGKILGTVVDGTTNEELLSVLINRLNYLNVKMPCRENYIAITKLQEALMWQEYRTVKRKMQGIESTNIPHPDVSG